MPEEKTLHAVPKFIQIAIEPSDASAGGMLYALDEQGESVDAERMAITAVQIERHWLPAPRTKAGTRSSTSMLTPAVG